MHHSGDFHAVALVFQREAHPFQLDVDQLGNMIEVLRVGALRRQ